MRLSREQMFMQIAEVVSRRSTCARLNVGAIITVENRIVSIGYNGRPAKDPHCEGNKCLGRTPGQCGTIHAEINALNYLPREFGDSPYDLYVTHSPCSVCSSQLSCTALRRVYFSVPYRDTKGLDLLVDRGRLVYQITSAGYITDYRNNWVLNSDEK